MHGHMNVKLVAGNKQLHLADKIMALYFIET
jgi:hypothetical protein